MQGSFYEALPFLTFSVWPLSQPQAKHYAGQTEFTIQSSTQWWAKSGAVSNYAATRGVNQAKQDIASHWSEYKNNVCFQTLFPLEK